MFDVLYFILHFISIIIALLALDCVYNERRKDFIQVTIILLIISFIGMIYTYATTDFKTLEKPCIVKTINNIAVAEIDGELINLNKTFGREFKDEESITILVPDPDARYLGFLRSCEEKNRKWLK